MHGSIYRGIRHTDGNDPVRQNQYRCSGIQRIRPGRPDVGAVPDLPWRFDRNYIRPAGLDAQSTARDARDGARPVDSAKLLRCNSRKIPHAVEIHNLDGGFRGHSGLITAAAYSRRTRQHRYAARVHHRLRRRVDHEADESGTAPSVPGPFLPINADSGNRYLSSADVIAAERKLASLDRLAADRLRDLFFVRQEAQRA